MEVKCPICGATQEVTAEGVSDDGEVTCSSCGSLLGTWRDLKTADPVDNSPT